MYPQFLTYCSIIGLLVLGVSCRSDSRPLFPMLIISSITNGSSSRDPCLDNSFQSPVYQISNLTVSTVFIFTDHYPGFMFANFSIVDVANHNFTFHCAWWSSAGDNNRDYWKPFCTPAGGNSLAKTSRNLTLLNIHPDTLVNNRSNEDPIRFLEYWYCDIKNGETYPQVYQSRVEVFIDAICPSEGSLDVEHVCTISNQLPLTVKAQWQPTGALPGTPRLVSRPTSSKSEGSQSGLDPPPSRDCNEISLSHPDWTVSELTYTPEKEPGAYKTAILNLSLASRASGTRMTCAYGGEASTEAEGQVLIPACFLQQNTSMESRSRLAVKFHGHDQWLSIQEDWTCGDTKGLYSTNFTAIANFTLPDTLNGTSYTAPGPITIKGTLTRPLDLAPALIPAPPGSNSPYCLSGPPYIPPFPFHGGHQPQKDMWTLTRFFYESRKEGTSYGAFNGTADGSYPWLTPTTQSLDFELRNEAINFTQSCRFTNTELDETTNHWFHCADPTPLHTFPKYSIDTYFQFNRDLGSMKVNQTWYCNGKEPENIPVRIKAQGSTRDGRYWYGTPIACGSGINVSKNVTCGTEPRCDYVISSQWCSLYSSRDGRPEGYPLWGGQYGGGIPMTDNATEALPSNAITAPDPQPDQWSCTIGSLGRGPVTWTLMTPYSGYFVLTLWYGNAEDSAHDQLNTRLHFEMASSVFQGMDPDPSKGWVHHIGSGSDWPGAMQTLTPWLRGWDPTNTMRPGGNLNTFYNAMDWAVRLDLSTGYLELNHSWYCDDKDPLNPIIFNGTWNGYPPLNCSYNFATEDGPSGNRPTAIKCLLSGVEGGNFTITPSVTHYTVNHTMW